MIANGRLGVSECVWGWGAGIGQPNCFFFLSVLPDKPMQCTFAQYELGGVLATHRPSVIGPEKLNI